MRKDFKYIFGPVPSRRLGLSLGVDIVPYKTCTYDCIYCQLGRTTDLTTARRSYAPVLEILKELEENLSSITRADFITFSGSGEPTLHSGIGDIVDGIKKITKIPVALLTNGSLLWLPEVRNAILNVDIVLPSLDAATPEIFSRINRPHSDINYEKMLSGLISFRQEYRGQIWLEIFLVKGINDNEDEISRMADLVEKIAPDKVQLNTAVRPTAERSVEAVDIKTLEKIASKFKRAAEIIADVNISHDGDERGCMDDILAMIARRPCTADDVSKALGLNVNEVIKYLEVLRTRSDLTSEYRSGKLYYIAKTTG